VSRVSTGLTNIRVAIHEFGSVAARMLMDQIEGDESSRRRVRFTPDLVVRESTVGGRVPVPQILHPAIGAE
jgi:DNA-binding LacI/PurR family transcriptional regulator